jgi:uncharacterized protein (DUF2236 family)
MLATAGYALVLQVAHPTVGAGVHEHSGFVEDPWGRLLRTLDYVHGTVYGGPELAGTTGARIRGLHRRPGLWRALRGPLALPLQLATAGLLPPRLRERLGLPFDGGRAAAFRTLCLGMKAAGPLRFGPLREFGPFYVRARRLGA